LSRIINPDSAGKERNRLIRGVALAVREAAHQTEPGDESRDLVAFIVLALDIISGTIDNSVSAWEKRGYWVKADKFRMEWAWAADYAEKLRASLVANDWNLIVRITGQLPQKLHHVTVRPGNRLGKPWVGAWKHFLNQYK